jgi:hypothetical protein
MNDRAVAGVKAYVADGTVEEHQISQPQIGLGDGAANPILTR